MPQFLALTTMVQMIDSWLMTAHQDPAAALASFVQLQASLQALYQQVTGRAAA